MDAMSLQAFLARNLTVYWTAYSSIIRPRLLELAVRHVRERMVDNLTAQARMQDLAAGMGDPTWCSGGR